MKHGQVHLTERDNHAENRAIQRLANDGKLKRVGDGIYVEPGADSTEAAVYAAFAPILAKLAPDAVLSGVTGQRGSPLRNMGADGRPVYPGWVFATHTNGPAKKIVSIPGLEIRSNPGPGPLAGDTPFMGVYLPSMPRKILENLKPSRERDGPARTLGQVYAEEQLDRILKEKGEDGLVRLVEHARSIAVDLRAEKELAVLEGIADALQNKGDFVLKSVDVAARRRVAYPYDISCLNTLKDLAMGLQASMLDKVDDVHLGRDKRECVSFMEAYFSNYIEGTKFLVDKARRIVFLDEEPDGRPLDGKDLVQTYKQAVALRNQIEKIERGDATAQTFEAFVDELRERHAHLLGARENVKPGMFKVDPNMAGNHVFVRPDLVVGTLREGFAIMQGLDPGIMRGLFVHSLSVLVHPFNDGNGRISRLLMNKEIVGNGETRILVPTLGRNDYIGGMRALTRPDKIVVGPFIRAMTNFQKLSVGIAEENMFETIRQWGGTNAFLEDEKGAQLLRPDPDREVECRKGVHASKGYWAEIDEALSNRDDGFTF